MNAACALCHLFGAMHVRMAAALSQLRWCGGVINCGAPALWHHQHFTDKACLYCRDASRASVLEAAGISKPRALAVVYTARARLVSTVHSLREHFPNVSPHCGAAICKLHLCCSFPLVRRCLHVFAFTILFVRRCRPSSTLTAAPLCTGNC